MITAFDTLIVVVMSIKIYDTIAEDGVTSASARSCYVFTAQHGITSQTAYIYCLFSGREEGKNLSIQIPTQQVKFKMPSYYRNTAKGLFISLFRVYKLTINGTPYRGVPL